MLLLIIGAADPDLARCAAVEGAEARLACYDALARRAAKDPEVPAAAAPTPGPVAPPADFGMPKAEPASTALAARLVGPFREWQRGTQFKLDNGQVWAASGDDTGYYPGIPDNAEVEIRQGLMGGYWLEIKAIKRKIRVRRIS